MSHRGISQGCTVAIGGYPRDVEISHVGSNKGGGTVAIEDITFLFQLADRSDFTGDRFQTFKARVYWLYCNWHFHHGRVEEAISILDLVVLRLLF